MLLKKLTSEETRTTFQHGRCRFEITAIFQKRSFSESQSPGWRVGRLPLQESDAVVSVPPHAATLCLTFPPWKKNKRRTADFTT